ncbi:MAG: VWA domain-containing protein [Chloroflexi bacterium]|nr:VWA domain-containing protein [Chloroflexota bacterium]MCA2002413.1 VWA domain-containing protein [Chloroflexota bacterium]
MKTLRKAAGLSVLFALLFLTACGGAAAPTATAAPDSRGYEYQAPETEEYFAPAPTQAVSGAGQPLAGAPAPKNGSQPYDMFFEDYGVNPSIDTEDDNLSTFALDVDTGSYAVMRNYLNEGNLPPAASVRVEEYINYFEQGYPAPSERQTFGVYVDGGPSPFTQTERYHMMRVGIQGYEVPEEERKDANLVFVIDVSGSMDMDNRLGLVKRSLELLVERLRPDDTVSIAVYGSDARVVLEPTRGSRSGKILDAIYSLEPEGATNAEAGIRLGYQMAMRAFKPDGINRVILCSDGVANVGQTEADEILREIRGYVEEGVWMTTIGFGMDNYNDTLMERLADDGNGFYAYVDDIDEAERLFLDNLTSSLQTIALDAKAQVDFNPDVVMRYRLVGYENRAVADEDFRDNTVDAGEIGAGHTVTALYEIKLYPQARGRIATVNMRWEDPDTRQVTEISKDFNTGDLAYDFRETDPYFQRAVIVAEYAEILKNSYWAEGSSLDDVYDEARRIAKYFERDDEMEEFVELVRQARRMRD